MVVSETVAALVGIIHVAASKHVKGFTLAVLLLMLTLGLFVFQSTGFLVVTCALAAVACASKWLHRFLRSGLLASLGLYVGFAFLAPGIMRVHKALVVRAETPYVSLAQRIQPHPSAPVFVIDRNQDSIRTNPQRGREQPAEFGLRPQAIRTIHQAPLSQFLTSQFFGFGDVQYDPFWAAEDRGELVELTPDPEHILRVSMSEFVQDDSARRIGAKTIARISDAHRKYTNWFVTMSRLGDIKDVNAVAGFLSHAITLEPNSEISGHDAAHLPLERWDAATQSFQRDIVLVQMQLIGAELHREPVAYVTNTLPELVSSEHASQRSLTEFEMESIGELVGGKAIHLRQRGHTVQVVGALRNEQSCMECHLGPQNQLLGAFSYDFVIDPPRKKVNRATGQTAIMIAF